MLAFSLKINGIVMMTKIAAQIVHHTQTLQALKQDGAQETWVMGSRAK